MTLAPRTVTRRDVLKFSDYCIVLRAIWTHYQTIFEGPELKREMLQNVAPMFLSDLNILIIEHLILQICKITDPEATGGKRNLTISFLVKNANCSSNPRELAKITRIAARIEKFRQRILPARNKFISHLDLDAALSRKSLGGASVAAWLGFWFDLQDFLTIMHARYVRATVPFYLSDVGGMSDADQLVRAIKESSYFRAALDDIAITRRLTDIAFASKYYDV